MDRQHIINIIELASIIITGSLGIAGTITHTRDKEGNLTKWGIITVIGIMLSNSFSLIQNYLKQEKAQTDQYNTEKKESAKDVAEKAKEKAKDVADKKKFEQTAALLNDNALKAEKSLAEEEIIQKQSSEVLTKVKHSIGIQNKIFNKSEVLNKQQLEMTDDIERTLNPLLPFKIDLSFFITPTPNTYFSAFTMVLNREI